MPLFWFSLACLSGMLAASSASLPLIAWISLAGVTLALAVAQRFKLLYRWPAFASLEEKLAGLANRARIHLSLPFLALLASAALGGARYQAAVPSLQPPDLIAVYREQKPEVVVEGWLAAPPDVRDSYSNLRLSIFNIMLQDGTLARPVDGLILVQALPGGDWRYGDRLRCQGRLISATNDEDFSYQEYLARQGIHALLLHASVERVGSGAGSAFMAAIYTIRARLHELVYRQYPNPEASLISGILLGIETGIPEHIQQAFQLTGTAHIVAISGFNISILAGLFAWLFSRLFGRWRGAVLAALAIGLYTLLVGAAPAVMRAALMGGLALFARQLGRRQDGLNSLALVAALMALHNPFVLWDIGFQLSFAATLGLILYANPMMEGLSAWLGRRLSSHAAQLVSRLVGEYFLFTLAAQVTVLPVIIYHFRQLSLISLLANPLVLPAQPPLMVGAGMALGLGMLWEPLGQLGATLAWPFAAYTLRCVEWLGGWRGAAIALGPVALWGVLAYYAAMLGVTFYRPQLAAYARKISPGFLAAALLVLNALAWRAVLAAPDGRLHLTVLNVSSGSQSGEALLLRAPSGQYILINGGPSATALSEALGRRLPLAARRLEYLVVAGVSDGQLGALPAVLERYPPGDVLWGGLERASRGAQELQAKLERLEIPQQTLQTGQKLDLGQGAELRVLAAGRRGALLLLAYGNFRLLLPCGLDFEMLDRLDAARQVGPLSALLLAEGGYAPLNPPEWLAKLRPQLVLLSVSPLDVDGLPSPETLEALEALAGYTLLRTDRHGWIEITTDGEQMWVEVEKSPAR
jgi:competence protein ComEC